MGMLFRRMSLWSGTSGDSWLKCDPLLHFYAALATVVLSHHGVLISSSFASVCWRNVHLLFSAPVEILSWSPFLCIWAVALPRDRTRRFRGVGSVRGSAMSETQRMCCPSGTHVFWLCVLVSCFVGWCCVSHAGFLFHRDIADAF